MAAYLKLMSVQGSTSEIFDEDGSSTRFYLRYLIDAVSFIVSSTILIKVKISLIKFL